MPIYRATPEETEEFFGQGLIIPGSNLASAWKRRNEQSRKEGKAADAGLASESQSDQDENNPSTGETS